MRCGFIMDPIESIKPAKDTSLALMLEAQRQGYAIEYFTPADIGIKDGAVFAQSTQLEVYDAAEVWHKPLADRRIINPAELDIIFMRQDPPVDSTYLYVTYLLEALERQGVTIVNSPKGVRDINEKLSTLSLADCAPPTLVSANLDELKTFITEQGEAIIKPIWEMGGKDIYYLTPNDRNINVILETLTRGGRSAIIAQQYLADIARGDKRVIMINGEPVPYALTRLPKQGDTRANLAAGGDCEGAYLSQREQWICERVGPLLRENAVILAGMDIIGGYLTEINVTSPTCLREIERAFNINLCQSVLSAINGLK